MASDLFTIQGKIALNYSDAISNIDKVKDSAKKAATSLDDIDESADNASGSIHDAGKSAESTDDKFSTWKVTLGNLVTTAITTLIDKVGELAGDIVELGTSTETAFAKLETIAGTENIGDLKDSISELSKETGVSSADLANVAYNAISAGASAEDAMDMVTAATKLGVAGFTDADSALSVLSTAMNSYGDSAGTVEEISDSLIQVQNLGVTTIGDLSSTMGKAIATGSAYNVSLGNLESAYVSITKAGISTEEGTTYLNSMLNELGDSGSDVSSILQEQTGKSFSDLMEEGYSLSDVLGILYDSCDGDSTALMNLWSSAEAGKASNAIVNQGLEEFNENLDTITSSTGSTESAYSTMADTMETKISKMKTSFEDLGLKIFDGLEGPLSTAIDFITNSVVPGLETLIENFDKIAPVVAAVTAAFVAYKVAMGISSVIDALTKATEGTTIAQAALNLVLNMNPIVLIVTLIAGLIAALVTLWNTSDGFRDALSAAGEKIKNVFETVAAFFTETFLPPIQAVWDKITEAVGVVVEWFKTNVLPGVQEVMGAVSDAFSKAWEVIKVVWDLVSPYFETLWGVIKTIFSVVKDVLGGFFKAAWEAIKAVWDVVVSFFKTIWNTIKGIFSVVKSVLTGDFKGAWEGIKSIFSGFADFFKTLWNSVKKIFSAVGTFFKDAFKSAWNGIKSIFSGVGDFFKGIFDKITGIFSSIGEKIGGAVSGAISSAVNWILEKAIGIINGFIKAINFAIGIINKIPGVSINKLNELEVPEMAEGGVLEKGQVGLLEGEGQEAVIPLEKNTGWIQRTASSLADFLPQRAMSFTPSDFLNSTAISDFTASMKNDVMSDVESKLDELHQTLAAFMEMSGKYFPTFSDTQIVLDNGVLVGELAPSMDVALGNIARRKGR